ncbi:MAG: translation initiation factor IF-1 [Acidobacteria bacterium]|nr:translation initiation factor IF-1 [Acidobacteriota bacterium]MDA1233770.1 translation initiation factor IF-1 [Acidobacteriota bacterium]
MGSDDEVGESGNVRGEVIEELPSALYRVALSDRREILAGVAERRGMDFLRILPGDRVQVRLSPHDDRRGRIVGKDSK